MRVKEAIKRADALRPNAISEERKADWLYELEGRLAQVRHAPPLAVVPPPARVWPADSALAMPPPYDGVYERYLCAMIDLANQETALYANDMAVFESTYADAVAWWRRTHSPAPAGNWKV